MYSLLIISYNIELTYIFNSTMRLLISPYEGQIIIVPEEVKESDRLDLILNRRTNPGVLIFDREDRLLYSNKVSDTFLNRSIGNEKKDGAVDPLVPREITLLCNRLKGSGKSGISTFVPNINQKTPVQLYAATAHFIQPAGNLQDHIIVIIQPLVPSHIDPHKIAEEYDLSKREVEVLKLICGGCSNREISERLCISEFTTRDHLKNIMRKMGVSSRNKIIARAM